MATLDTTESFDPYEGLKISAITAIRTIDGIDAVEITSRLMWSILAMNQAAIYAMQLEKQLWNIEYESEIDGKKTKKARPLNRAIAQSTNDATFVKQYQQIQPPTEEKKEIDEIEYIRNIVLHGNTEPLAEWTQDIGRLKILLKRCGKIVKQISEENYKKNPTQRNKSVKEYCDHMEGLLTNHLSPIPNS